MLRKTSARLVVEKGGQVILELPAHQVDRVLIFGAIQISTQAMSFLLDSGIEVSFLSMKGRLKGKLSPVESKNVFLRLAQYDKSRDEGFKLKMAGDILDAKIKNQRTLILRYQRNHPGTDFSAQLRTISDSLDALPHKKTIPALMGLEGASTGAYFHCFSRMLSPEFVFDKRTRHPPLDPVNSLLSLGYTLLTNEIGSLVEAMGFDPFIGFLHGLRYGRQSLPLDLVEEFRHPVVDGIVLSLINKGSIGETDFRRAEEDALLLDKPAFGRFLTSYEDRMQKPFQYEGTGCQTSYRSLIRHQVEMLEGALLNKKEYGPFLVQ